MWSSMWLSVLKVRSTHRGYNVSELTVVVVVVVTVVVVVVAVSDSVLVGVVVLNVSQ